MFVYGNILEMPMGVLFKSNIKQNKKELAGKRNGAISTRYIKRKKIKNQICTTLI